MTARGLTPVAFALGIAIAPAPARADVEDELGLGVEAAAMAGAVGALPVGAPSLWYAPATLSLDEDEPGFVELTVGSVFAHPIVHVDGTDGADIELAVEPRSTAAFHVGTRFDLGHAFGVRGLNAAVSFYSPVTKLFAYSIHPDESVQWLDLTDRTQHFGVQAGLALRIARWLSVGAAVRVLFDLQTYTTGAVTEVTSRPDPATGETMVNAETRLGESVRVFGRAAPTVSIASRPFAELGLSLTWRSKILVDDWGWTRTSASEGLPALGYVHRFVHYYRPHEVSLAASLEVRPDVVIAAEATYGRWSTAPSKNARRLEGRWGDTVSPALAARWNASEPLALMGGYRFVPSPFDNFGGPTNFLDNDEHVGSVGAELALDPVTVRGSLRLAWLVSREEIKDWRRFASDFDLERNPGYPGYRHGGVVPSAQLELEAAW
jgi:hypothetical protein